MYPKNNQFRIQLAEYFSEKPFYSDEATQKKPNTRKLVELSFQQTKARLWNEVTNTLCNLEFIQAKAGTLNIKHRGVLKTPSGLMEPKPVGVRSSRRCLKNKELN